jgi:hypothetical protein
MYAIEITAICISMCTINSLFDKWVGVEKHRGLRNGEWWGKCEMKMNMKDEGN